MQVARRIATLLFLTAICSLPAQAEETPSNDSNATTVRQNASPHERAWQPWFSFGFQTGFVKPDASFADYQWDTRPQVTWGAEALAGEGRWALGARFLRSSNTQEIDATATAPTTTVRMTSLELVGKGRVVSVLGTDVFGMASVGRVHLGYSPDQVTIDPTGLGITVDVEFEPVNEWIVGGGMAIRRDLASAWAAGLEIDHRVFSLETAHRNGNSIEFGRESFGDWSARLGLAWQYGR